MNKLAFFFTVSTKWNHQNIQHPKWRQIFWQPCQNPYTSSLFNESPIFNDVRFLSDSGFLFSSKKKLCWGHPNLLLHWIYIKKHMVAYENNKFRHDVHICQPGLISKAYWPVWKCAYMLWKWQHLAILQRCLDLNLLGKYFYAAYLYTYSIHDTRTYATSFTLFAAPFEAIIGHLLGYQSNGKIQFLCADHVIFEVLKLVSNIEISFKFGFNWVLILHFGHL